MAGLNFQAIKGGIRTQSFNCEDFKFWNVHQNENPAAAVIAAVVVVVAAVVVAVAVAVVVAVAVRQTSQRASHLPVCAATARNLF